MRLAFLLFSVTSGLLGSAWCDWVLAANYSVSPLRATMDGSRNAEVLTLRNTDSAPILIQPTVVKWSQKDGKEVLEPTRDVLISPALIEVPSGESQVVRVALRRPQDPTQELTYRIVLKEVPRSAAGTGAKVVIALNISLPLFVVPKTAEAKPNLQIVESKSEKFDGKQFIRVGLRNSGNMHLQLKNLAISDSAGAMGEYNSMFYILSGNSTTIRIPLARKLITDSVRFDAQTDAGTVGQEIKIP